MEGGWEREGGEGGGLEGVLGWVRGGKKVLEGVFRGCVTKYDKGYGKECARG